MNDRPPVPDFSNAVVWLDASDVAARLSTTTKQIANMRARGQILPPVYVRGLGLRWSARAFNEWMLAIIGDVASRPLPHTPASTGPLRTGAKPAQAPVRVRVSKRRQSKDIQDAGNDSTT